MTEKERGGGGKKYRKEICVDNGSLGRGYLKLAAVEILSSFSGCYVVR